MIARDEAMMLLARTIFASEKKNQGRYSPETVAQVVDIDLDDALEIYALVNTMWDQYEVWHS